MTLLPKEEAVLKLIGDDISYENYFFNKLSNIIWFYPLKGKGYFTPEKAPMPKPAEQKGFFTIPQWNVLPYLEKVSQQVNIAGNEKYIDELLLIIKDVTRYHIDNEKILDNYRTWWYFVKILCNLPTEKITNEIIDLIPIWLDSKFDNMVPAREIVGNLLPKFLNSDAPEDLQKVEKIIDIVTQVNWVSEYTEQQKKEIKEEYKHIFEKPKEERTEEERLEIAFWELDKKKPKTIVDTHWLVESLINQNAAIRVGEKCGENIIFNLADKLKEIFKHKYPKGKYDLSYIWFGPIFEPLEHISGAEVTLTLILKNMFLAKAQKDEQTTRNIFEKFSGDKYQYPLFKRLVLFVVGCEWNTYKDIFWDVLRDDKKYDLFNDSHYEAEVFTILQKHINQFSAEEKGEIKNIVEKKVPRKPHLEKKHRESYSAYQKQKWYSAVKSDEYFKPLYEKYKNITGKEEELSFKESKVRVGSGPSPLTKEEILKMSNKELAKYLKEFKTINFWKGPTINGLSHILKNAVQEMPEKFINDLKPFLKTGYLYVCNILSGIWETREKKKIIAWGKLFDFIKKYITPQDFWEDKYKIKGDDWETVQDHLWVIGMIGELIRQENADDAWAFSEKHFHIAQEILFLIADKMLAKKEIEQHTGGDFVTFALNSPWGKITEALFMLAMRIKRTEEKSQKKQSVSWEVNIKKKYEELLGKEIIETYVWLGQYLPNFHYLDEKWTKDKIKTINIAKEQLWEAFMQGYLSGSTVYNELYILMKIHYENALSYQFKEKHFSDRLAQHISIGYLRGIEDINNTNSLFRKLLGKWDTSQIQEIIGFFWMQRRGKEQLIEDEEREKIENKIIDFWRWVYENNYKEKQENNLDNEDKKILSELCNLTKFLTEINSENFEWLKMSALYADVNYRSSFFIEYLNKLKDKNQSVDFVGKVYLEILKNATPSFREEDIQSIVEFLICPKDKKGKIKEEGNEICNIYASRGYEFLKQLYERCNKT